MMITSSDSNMMQDVCQLILYFFENFVKNKQNFNYCFENYVTQYYIKNLFLIMDQKDKHIEALKDHLVDYSGVGLVSVRPLLERGGAIPRQWLVLCQ